MIATVVVATMIDVAGAMAAVVVALVTATLEVTGNGFAKVLSPR